MATELITRHRSNSYTQGELNWFWTAISPAAAAGHYRLDGRECRRDFLGISHMNCLLCHNGRGHLDQLSLWGTYTTRYQAWDFASFLSRTTLPACQLRSRQPQQLLLVRARTTPKSDYSWHHHRQSSGARPLRHRVWRARRATCRRCTSSQAKPKPGENYRAALARIVTVRLQFARAMVNYSGHNSSGAGSWIRPISSTRRASIPTTRPRLPGRCSPPIRAC